jgi:hypothetical protein
MSDGDSETSRRLCRPGGALGLRPRRRGAVDIEQHQRHGRRSDAATPPRSDSDTRQRADRGHPRDLFERDQLRWEIYDVFNQVQFATVDSTARFDAAGNQVNTRFGQVITTRAPRVMQVALRVVF